MDPPASPDPICLNADGDASPIVRSCELCGAGASLLCSADQAYLCWDCDATVHGANFLVARHKRSLLCQVCCTVTVRVATGDQPEHMPCVCPICQPQQETEIAVCAPEVNEEEANGNSVHRQECVEQQQCQASSASQQGETGQEYEAGSCCASRNQRSLAGKKRPKCEKGSECEALSSCLSPRTVLSCPRSPSDDTMEEEVQDSEDTNEQITIKQERCSTPGNVHDQEETSSSYPSIYGTAPSKRRRLQATTGSRSQDLLQEDGLSWDESRVDRALSRWHWELGFSSPRVISLALHIYRRGVRAIRASQSSGDTSRQTLAASLWLAAKLDDEQTVIPGATQMGVCAGVSARRLVAAESQLLQRVDWRSLQRMLG